MGLFMSVFPLQQVERFVPGAQHLRRPRNSFRCLSQPKAGTKLACSSHYSCGTSPATAGGPRRTLSRQRLPSPPFPSLQQEDIVQERRGHQVKGGSLILRNRIIHKPISKHNAEAHAPIISETDVQTCCSCKYLSVRCCAARSSSSLKHAVPLLGGRPTRMG